MPTDLFDRVAVRGQAWKMGVKAPPVDDGQKFPGALVRMGRPHSRRRRPGRPTRQSRGRDNRLAGREHHVERRVWGQEMVVECDSPVPGRHIEFQADLMCRRVGLGRHTGEGSGAGPADPAAASGGRQARQGGTRRGEGITLSLLYPPMERTRDFTLITSKSAARVPPLFR
jgi:hypothetical protein